MHSRRSSDGYAYTGLTQVKANMSTAIRRLFAVPRRFALFDEQAAARLSCGSVGTDQMSHVWPAAAIIVLFLSQPLK